MRRRTFPPSNEDASDEPLINLTPLIDVVFVVLISFILIAPLLEVDSIDLAPGISSHPIEMGAIQNGRLTIYIRSDNSIWLQEKQCTWKELETHLAFMKKQYPQEIPKMIPDARSHFETYCKVKNILESCGFLQVDLILRPS